MDHASIVTLISNYLQQKYPTRLTNVAAAQLFVRIVDAVSVLGDLAFYRIDVVARELYAATARQRSSITNIAKPYGYTPFTPGSATVALTLTLNPGGPFPTNVSHAEQYSNGSTTDEVFFQPTTDTFVASYPMGGTLTVDAVEGELYEQVLVAVSSGAPNMRVQLPQSNVVLGSVNIFVNNVLWAPTLSWSGTNASSQVYKLKYDDSGHTFLVFGDGNYGAIPANSNVVRGTFRVGGGSRGNLSGLKGTITTLVRPNSAVLSVTNALAPDGGVDFETVKSTRTSIPAALITLQRVVTHKDYAEFGRTLAGIAQASGTQYLPGGRTERIIVAPTGGGLPTATQKNQVVAAYENAKMASTDVFVDTGYTYKDLLLGWVIYVLPNFIANTVQTDVRNFFTNGGGTGIYDFDQLAPAGLDAKGNPLLSQTLLQGYAENSLQALGVSRLVVNTFTIRPSARTRQNGNIGNGIIANSDITSDGHQKRREYYILFKSATTYTVTERINGYVTNLSDNVLTDDSQDFIASGVQVGWKVAPNRAGTTYLVITGVDGQDLVTTGSISLLAVTSPGTEYYAFNPVTYTGVVGSTTTSSDGSVTFKVTAGSTAFVAGDAFSIDVFPVVSDIILRADEYPQLSSTFVNVLGVPDFNTRTSGGLR